MLGARIDHAHHGNSAKQAISETLALEKAVAAALKTIGERSEETLVIVTADHSHGLSMASSAKRGNPILGMMLPLSISHRNFDNIFTLFINILQVTLHSFALFSNFLGVTDYSHGNRDGRSDVDEIPYTTLTYANGPGFQEDRRAVSFDKTGQI